MVAAVALALGTAIIAATVPTGAAETGSIVSQPGRRDVDLNTLPRATVTRDLSVKVQEIPRFISKLMAVEAARGRRRGNPAPTFGWPACPEAAAAVPRYPVQRRRSAQLQRGRRAGALPPAHQLEDRQGLPAVLVQAMAFGCPVVSMGCPTWPCEILADARFAPLVPGGDSRAIAGAIGRFLDPPVPVTVLRARAARFQSQLQSTAISIQLASCCQGSGRRPIGGLNAADAQSKRA